MQSVVPSLYGDRITEAEAEALLVRLRARGSPEAAVAAQTIRSGRPRDATVASALEARDAILLELVEWVDLADSAPGLVGLRDRLAVPMGRRTI